MDELPVFLVLSAPIAQVVNALTHVVTARCCFRNRPMPALGVGFLAGFATLVALLFFTLPLSVWPITATTCAVLLSLVAYGALAAGYFIFVNLNLASLRIRILREIYDGGQGRLDLRDIYREYDARAILDMRLQRLVDGRMLVEEGGRYRLGTNPVFFFLGQMVWGLKGLLMRAPSWKKNPGTYASNDT